MEWSYCSAKMASFLVCSSFSLFSTALWSDLGVDSSRWFLRALYCLVWVLHVSWNCFLIWSSLAWERKKKKKSIDLLWELRERNIWILQYNRRKNSYLEAFGLLSDLHYVLAPQLPLPPLVIFQLIGELRLVLCADELSPCLLNGAQVPELQFLHWLMVPEQHGMFQVLLSLTFIELLQMKIWKSNMKKKNKKLFNRNNDSILVVFLFAWAPLWPDPAPHCAWQ